MIQLNLLPDLKKEFIEAQRARNRVIAMSILVCIVVVGATLLAGFYVYGIQNVQIALINSGISDNTKKLKSVKDINKYLTLQSQLAALPDLHSNKNVYSRIFDFLPTLNPSAPNNVKLSSVQVSDTNKTITFSGTTSTFLAMNTFKDALSNAKLSYAPKDSTDIVTEPLFDTVTLTSASLGTSSGAAVVSFTITTTYKSEALVASSSDVAVTVPTISNTGANGLTPVFGGSQ